MVTRSLSNYNPHSLIFNSFSYQKVSVNPTEVEVIPSYSPQLTTPSDSPNWRTVATLQVQREETGGVSAAVE